MPLDTLDPGSETHNRWDEFRVRESDQELTMYWYWWSGLSFISAAASFYVIVLILRAPSLRKQLFNKYVVALALPDFLFSFACVWSCLINAIHGTWTNKNLNCEFQSVYCIFGMAASVWMNVVVTRELYHRALGSLSVRFLPYQKTSERQCFIQVAGVYTVAMGFACMTLIPGLPLRANSIHGLACLPVEFDLHSSVFFWAFFTPLLLFVPFFTIFYYFYRLWEMHILSFRTLIGLPPCELEQEDLQDGSSTGTVVTSHSVTSPVTELSCVIGRQGEISSEVTRVLAHFFARLLVVLLVMWVPSLVMIWIVGNQSGAVAFSGGSWSHLQGLVSALFYLHKKDIFHHAHPSVKKNLLCSWLVPGFIPNKSSKFGSVHSIESTHAPNSSTSSSVDLAPPAHLMSTPSHMPSRPAQFDDEDYDLELGDSIDSQSTPTSHTSSWAFLLHLSLTTPQPSARTAPEVLYRIDSPPISSTITPSSSLVWNSTRQVHPSNDCGHPHDHDALRPSLPLPDQPPTSNSDGPYIIEAIPTLLTETSVPNTSDTEETTTAITSEGDDESQISTR